MSSALVSFRALRPPLVAYRCLSLGFRELMPTAAIPADLSHTAVTSHSKRWTCCLPSPRGQPWWQWFSWWCRWFTLCVGSSLRIVLCIWVCGSCNPDSCVPFPYRWIAGVYASLWPALRGTKTTTPSQMGCAISSAFHCGETRLPFLAYVYHEEDHVSPAFATGLGPISSRWKALVFHLWS